MNYNPVCDTCGTSPWASQQYDEWVLAVHMDVLAAEAHVGQKVDILVQGHISWSTARTPQDVATAVISEINTSYGRPVVVQNIPKSGPEYAATVPILGGTSVPSSRPALLDLESVSRGGMGLWSGWLRRRRLLKTDSEPQIRKEPHIR